ncbi:hypothetical protein Cob_v008744 [Colletotrichum orbiculare MAFF 240422]|uniref:Secreted protein n=1 Tax=Colletotrichum orbiculare (strain 104-T / ATCC 96160 / CBS 514.97 / LARS 414 / MAFF 240422) TaxID=1213857 RepID=A0A484FIP1_COLOR|nr:hypothetical protein Cob_v008744 [Colletotrichum orbiculare MAFF 240422]
MYTSVPVSLILGFRCLLAPVTLHQVDTGNLGPTCQASQRKQKLFVLPPLLFPSARNRQPSISRVAGLLISHWLTLATSCVHLDP